MSDVTKAAYSAGARYERAALRKYLERKIKNGEAVPARTILGWVRGRQARYDQKPGGL